MHGQPRHGRWPSYATNAPTDVLRVTNEQGIQISHISTNRYLKEQPMFESDKPRMGVHFS